MDINFAPPKELVELAEKTKAFVVDKVIPLREGPALDGARTDQRDHSLKP